MPCQGTPHGHRLVCSVSIYWRTELGSDTPSRHLPNKAGAPVTIIIINFCIVITIAIVFAIAVGILIDIGTVAIFTIVITFVVITVTVVTLFIIDVVVSCPEPVCWHRTSILVSTAGGGWCGTTAWAAVS